MASLPVPVRILLVEDHHNLRRSIRTLLEREKRYEVCGEAATVAEGIEVALATQPRLAIVDLALEQGNGIDLIEALKNRLPGIAVLVLSMHSEQLYSNAALRAGASGYLMKMQAPEHLCEAVDCVLGGGVWLSQLPPG